VSDCPSILPGLESATEDAGAAAEATQAAGGFRSPIGRVEALLFRVRGP